MQLALIPIQKTHRDVVFTPPDVARDIVEFFKPSGKILEPAKGDGVFLRYLPNDAEWCEIREGRDFFAWTKPMDWIISNPPYSCFSDWLRHSFEIAPNIVYLIPTNKPFNGDRLMREIYQWGGIKSIYQVGTGSSLKFEIGYAIAAVHFKKDWRGGIDVSFRFPLDKTDSNRL